MIIGEEVLMLFNADRDFKAIKLRGTVAHATRWGIGVEFTANPPHLDLMIGNFIQRIV